MGQLFEALETQVGPTQHQQGRNQPRCKGADRQGRWHQDGLVEHRALGYRPHHWELALGAHAADLLGVEGEIVAEHARRLPRCDFGHGRDVVENAGDVVEQ